jgi:hypothetical protein
MLVLHYEWSALFWSFSSGVGVKFAQSSIQWEARADTWRNVPNPADQQATRSKETWINPPLTFLSQWKLALSARNIGHFLLYKIIGASNLKKWLHPLFWSITHYACPQKPNPFRETVPLRCRVMPPRKPSQRAVRFFHLISQRMQKCKNQQEFTAPTQS